MEAHPQDPEVLNDIFYESIHKKRVDENGAAFAAVHIPMAYIICAYVVFEGFFIIHEGTPSLGLHGPFSQSESVFLYIVAWGDIVSAFLGFIGIWFSHNLLPTDWRSTSRMHSTFAKTGTGILLAWRCLVLLSIAPWAGILLAFSPPQTDKVWMYILICSYICLSIFLVYILVTAFCQIVSDSERFQQHADKQALGERKTLLANASDARQNGDDDVGDMEVEPLVFGFFELAPTITLYTIIITIACGWSFLHVILTGQTAGGWAFFSSTPQVNTTFWWEVFLYPICFGCAIVGLAGAATLAKNAAVPGTNQSRAFVLIFFLSSALRFGLLFAVTGMCLLEKNSCGFYLHGIASIAYSSPSPAAGISIHCVATEWMMLAGVLLCFLLDGYLVWGTYKLYRQRILLDARRKRKCAGDMYDSQAAY
jgi:hypothetical protein